MQNAVACILFSDDRRSVLLIQRRDIPVWVLPGGGIDPSETPEAAVLREMREETGLDTRISRKIALYSPKNRLSAPTHFFEVTKISGSCQRGSETQDLKFFPLDALPRRLAPPYAYWIADALQNSPELIQKPVEGTSYWVLVKLLLLHPLLVGRFLLTKLGLHWND